MKLNEPVDKLKGVGTAVEERLYKLGVETVGDLLTHYPRRYSDFSNVTKIAAAKPGLVTLKGEITRINNRRTRKGRGLTEALITDDSGSIQAVWFNQPYLAKQLPRDKPVYVAGELAYKYQRYALQNPSVEPVGSFPKDTARIVPVYPQTSKLSSKQLRRLLKQALAADVPDPLPRDIRQNYGLLDKKQALRQIHFPDSTEQLEAARYRLAFEEFYTVMLLARELKQDIGQLEAPRITFDKAATNKMIDDLDFELTDDQRKAAWKILKDLDSPVPMNRLLQGDVGSGKTVVAAIAALQAVQNGFQAIFLAPTEILARQHFTTLEPMLELHGIKTVLISSGLKREERKEALERAANGQAQVVVGTHALLQPEVSFDNPGLVVIDEQHRFGVKQRQQLRNSGREGVHVLSMSATPIPRSLALTVYGDLDITSIRQLPEGRKPPVTEVVTGQGGVYGRVYDLIMSGNKAFVVCPLIDDSESLDASSVNTEVKKLRGLWPDVKIAGLHGRMHSKDKADTMNRFHNGELDVLVATTVVEVGIDVAEANVMLVEGAERFGLATLHQLRGRIGRGGGQAYCFLKPSVSGQALKRLELMERYSDGFVLAEQDLKLRGAGELYGYRQHGLMDLRLGRLSDTELINTVRSAVEATGKLSELPEMDKVIAKLKAGASLISAEAS